MSRYETSFEVDSKADSHAIHRLLEQVYDAVREESRTVREGSNDASELLQEFETLRNAAKEPSPGEIRIVYERYDDEFETCRLDLFLGALTGRLTERVVFG